MRKEHYARNRKEWRDWLQDNHDSEQEIWLVYFKKQTGKPSVGYTESVEEALCFGWIDGIKKRIDEERYTHRFTPRRSNSKWSELNIRLAEKLIKEGTMTEAGLASFRRRSHYGERTDTVRKQEELQLPTEIERVIKRNKVAWDNFENLAPSYRKQYVLWLTMAKRAVTKEKRLKEAIDLLEKNEKLGMK